MEPLDTGFFPLAVVFVSFVGLFGLGIMFSRASNIERTLLVGGMTVFTAAVSGVILATPAASATVPSLVSTCLVSTLGYIVGRVIDFLLGPREFHDYYGHGDLAD